MRTIQRTFTLFTLEELEDEARQRAYLDWLAKGYDYPFASENCNTLEAFCNLFHTVCLNYSYDNNRYNYSYRIECDDDIIRLSGIRLATYLHNNYHSSLFTPKTYWTSDNKKKRKSRIFLTSDCSLTGFIMDEIMLQPIYEFIKHPDNRTFGNLIKECMEAFFCACRDDCEYCTSEDYFKEESAEQNWEYLADGTFYRQTT